MLEVNNLSVCAKLTHGKKDIISGVTFSVRDGEKLGVVGKSGSGKTMTALALIGLLPKNCKANGSAVLESIELFALRECELRKLRGDCIVYIPQSGADYLNPSMTIRAHFTETLRRLHVKPSKRTDLTEQLLSKVGFDEPQSVLRKYPFQLSGGMAQRVLLALALAADAKLLIADEPTRGLDRDAAFAFMDLLSSLTVNCAVIVVTHDMEIAARCDRILELKNA